VHDAYTLLANFFFEKERRQNKCFVLANVFFVLPKWQKFKILKVFNHQILKKYLKS